MTLLALNDDILAAILLCLGSPRDLAHVALACRRLRDAASDEGRLWPSLCKCRFLKTSPCAWVAAAKLASQPGLFPSSFRAMYDTLQRQERLLGWWQGLGDAPRGALYRLSWGLDCLVLSRLDCGPQDSALRYVQVLCLGPAHPLHAAEPVGSSHLVIKRYRPAATHTTAAAAAAAATARGSGASLPCPTHSSPAPGYARSHSSRNASCELRAGSGPGPPSVVLGSSPTASSQFNSQLLQFMSSQVAGPRSSGRRNSRRQVPSSAAPVVLAGGPAAQAPAVALEEGSGADEAPSGSHWGSPGSAAGGSGVGGDSCTPSPRGPLPRAHSQRGPGRTSPDAGGRGAWGGWATPPSPCLASLPLATYQLSRLLPQAPSRQHPVAGLWQGVYGPHGAEVISVTYDFSSAAARINAVKVTGDNNVPAGAETWWAAAGPLPQPWSEQELRLQEARLWLADLGPPGGQAHAPPPAAAAGSEPEGGPHPRLPKVVACHLGQARIAGLNYSNPQWVPGRLWEYEGGGLAFMYCWPGSEEEPMFCVTFTRLP